MIQNVKGEAWTGQDEYFYGKNIAPYTCITNYHYFRLPDLFARTNGRVVSVDMSINFAQTGCQAVICVGEMYRLDTIQNIVWRK